jgi:hypothetical protein
MGKHRAQSCQDVTRDRLAVEIPDANDAAHSFLRSIGSNAPAAGNRAFVRTRIRPRATRLNSCGSRAGQTAADGTLERRLISDGVLDVGSGNAQLRE